MVYSGYIIDAVLIIILGVFAFLGFKKGFMKMALKTAGVFLAFTLAVSLSGPLATFVYDSVFAEKVAQSVDKSLSSYSEQSPIESLERIYDEDGLIGKVLRANNISPQSLLEKVKGNNLKDVGNYITKNLIRPAFIFFIKSICLIILLILFLLLVKVLANVLSKVFSISVIGSINRFLGLVTGILLGLIIATALCILLDSMLVVFPDGFLGISYKSQENSFIFKNICNFVQWTV